jgi:hypothetical protein
MTTTSPEPWSADWIDPRLRQWTKVMCSTGFEGKGVHSESWVDRAVAVGPALIADAYFALLMWTPEWQKHFRNLEQSKQQQQSQPVKRQAASIESGVAVQLALPI